MKLSTLRLVSGAALVAAAGLSSAANAQQPLDIVVRPVTTVLGAPFAIINGVLTPITGGFGGPSANTYNPEPARRAAVSTTPRGWAVVPPTVLKETGPRYAGTDFRRPIVLRRGSTVPGYVNTAPAENISLAGLAPGADYDFFVSSSNSVVFLNPGTRQVERIVR